MALDPWTKKKSLYGVLVPKSVEKPKIKWRVFPIIWSALKKTCTVIGAFVLITAFLVFWSVSSLVQQEAGAAKLPDKFALYIDLHGNMGDLPREASLADPFARPGMTIKDFVESLERAKTDARVKGIYARMEGGGYAIAHIQEMREAIKKFRESGKFTYIYSSSYGDGGGLGNYYLARAFQEIWMQPMGIVAISGVSAEVPFFRNVLDMVGVEPQFFQRKEFKSAYESMTNSQISEPNKRMMQYLISDISKSIQEDIAKDLHTTAANFKALIDKGLFTAPEAIQAKLIEKADYDDVLNAKINKLVTGNPKTDEQVYVDLAQYVAEYKDAEKNITDVFLSQDQKKKEHHSKPVIALIYAVGVIMPSNTETSSSGPATLFDDGVAAADEIAGAILDAAYDDSVKAIVLRIDSPGGSPVASETILRAITLAKENKKSVIVSMGPTAASGGYWIAAYADHIFVLPTTLTGSIGVIGGKFSAQALWQMLGVSWERIQSGANAGMWSMNTPFSATESERMNAMMDNIYNGFLTRVAKGRGMSVEQVDHIAGGRVWTGKSAVEIGLADKIGGLDDALLYAITKIGKKTKNEVDIVIMPKPLTAIERFIQMLETQAVMGKSLSAQASLLHMIKPLLVELDIIRDPKAYAVYEPLQVH